MIRQATGRVTTPTGLRYLGMAGSVIVSAFGPRPIGLIGVAVLTGAWLGLRRVTGTRWLLVTAGLWALPLLVAPPLFSGDATAYACQGQLFDHGLSPYRHGVADLPCTWLAEVPRLWWYTRSPYGPFWVALSGLAGVDRWWLAVAVLRVVALAGIVLIIGYGHRLARALGTDPSRVAWLGVASPLVLLHGVSGVHNDALMAGLVVAGLATAVDTRWGVRAGILLGLAVAVKVTAVVAVPFAPLLVPRRAWAGLTAAALASFAGVTAATSLGLGWLPALSGTATLIQWTSPPTGVGMAAGYLLRLAGRPELAPAALAVARGLGLAVLAVVLVALWWRARHVAGGVWTDERRLADPAQVLAHDERSEEGRRRPAGHRPARAERAPRAPTKSAVVRAAGLALGATALLGPVFFSWYALAPLAVLSTTPLTERTERRLAWLVAGLALIVLPSGAGIASMTKPFGAFGELVLLIVLAVWGVRRLHAGRARPTPTAR